MAFARAWGGFREAFGGVWEAFGGLLGPLGAIFDVISGCLYAGGSSNRLSEASGVDFGSILGGLGRVWGRFREGFGDVFGS